MKKLALNIEDLEVETFSTDSDGTGPQRGTVRARESYYSFDMAYSCPYEYCPISPTYMACDDPVWIETVLYYTDPQWYSCGGSCYTCPCYA